MGNTIEVKFKRNEETKVKVNQKEINVGVLRSVSLNHGVGNRKLLDFVYSNNELMKNEEELDQFFQLTESGKELFGNNFVKTSPYMDVEIYRAWLKEEDKIFIEYL